MQNTELHQTAHNYNLIAHAIVLAFGYCTGKHQILMQDQVRHMVMPNSRYTLIQGLPHEQKKRTVFLTDLIGFKSMRGSKIQIFTGKHAPEPQVTLLNSVTH